MPARPLKPHRHAAPAAAREAPVAGRVVKVVLGLWLGLSGLAISGCADLKWPAAGWPFRSDPAGAASSPAVAPNPGPGQTPPPAPHPEARPAAAAKNGPSGSLDNEIAMARLCERRGENDDAERMYLALLAKVPQDPRLHHRLGVLAVQKGNFSRAEEHFRAARSRAPAGSELLSDQGYCSYLQGRFKEAEDFFRQALTAGADSPVAITMATNNLGLAVGAQGRLDESLNLFKRVNSEAEAFANLAYVLAQTGQGARAQQMYLRALTLDNTMRAAAQAMLQVAERSQARVELAAPNCHPAPGAPATAPVTLDARAAADRPDLAPTVPLAAVGPTVARAELPAADGRAPVAAAIATQADVATGGGASTPLPVAAAPPRETTQTPATPLESPPADVQVAKPPAEAPPSATQATKTLVEVTAPAVEVPKPPAEAPPPATQATNTPVEVGLQETETPPPEGAVPPAPREDRQPEPPTATGASAAAGWPDLTPAAPLAAVRPTAAPTEWPAADERGVPGVAIASDADAASGDGASAPVSVAAGPPHDTTQTPATPWNGLPPEVETPKTPAGAQLWTTRATKTPAEISPPETQPSPPESAEPPVPREQRQPEPPATPSDTEAGSAGTLRVDVVGAEDGG